MAPNMDDLEKIANQANHQADMMKAALMSTMQNPIKIVSLVTSIVGCKQEGSNKVLSIAQPDGTRYDAELDAQAARMLGRALIAEPK